ATWADRTSGTTAADGAAADPAAAMAWCDAERRNIAAVTGLALTSGHPDAAWRIPVNLFGYFRGSRQSADWLAALEPLAAAPDLIDTEAQAFVHNGLAAACAAAGRYDEAAK